MDMSPLPKHIDTHGQKEVYVNLGLFAFGAYDQAGNLVYWGPVSSGAKKCPGTSKVCSTVTGKFRVFRIEGKNCISHEYPLETHGGDPMPYCMYFHGGAALHYSTLSGFINRSAGCIRMFKLDAKWLNHEFVKRGTLVVVKK
jgi:lipoprotein-anchoring transpeptidase ErfK/SrfK